MALLRGKLFAGALFAGALISGIGDVGPDTSQGISGGGGIRSVGKANGVKSSKPKFPSVQLSEIAQDTNAARIIRLQNDDEEVLLLITQAVGVLYG